MKLYLKNILFGFLSWFVPFVISFFFYTREGTLLIDIFLFKSIMIVVGSIVGAIFLVLYFKNIATSYLREGITVGIIWFAMNIVLDLLILIPMSKMPLPDYFMQIALRYFIIPAMSFMIGMVLTIHNPEK